ncbi:MAG TPA: response regulator [Candidatus Sulfotelmatobacter sp.]|jgi:DNA-binding response OmpR family regulator|nr:response regulator [Candidatus Sulfotelmatobacter sp.]
MAGIRLLVVDDEPEIVAILCEMLGEHGYVVDAARTAEQAIALIREHIYEVALIDFNLPDMDGMMLHRQIRQMDEELAGRTIFMSGLLQTEANLGYYRAESAGFVGKPFDLRDVLEQIQRVLEG